MFRFLFVVLVGCALIGTAIGQGDAKKERDLFVGQWQVESVIVDGFRAPKALVDPKRLLIIQGDSWKREKETPLTFTIDSSKVPYEIDFISAKDGKLVSKAIYELKEGTLKIGRNRKFDERPKGFESIHSVEVWKLLKR